jgi:hypothetical protein
MLAMYECDTLTNDDNDEMAYRERATAILDEVAAQARARLHAAGIGLDVYFVVPPSGDVILTLGAAVCSEEWQNIKGVVSSLVRRSVGLLEPSRCREIVCVRTHSDG